MRRTFWCLSLSALLLSFAAVPAGAVRNPGPTGALPDFVPTAAATASATAGLPPSVRARFGDGLRGRIGPHGGLDFVVRPGRGPLTAPRVGRTPESVARGFLGDHRDLLGLRPKALDRLVLRGEDPDHKAGLTFLSFGQRLDGHRVFGAQARLVVDDRGAVWSVATHRLAEGAPRRAHQESAASAAAGLARAVGVHRWSAESEFSTPVPGIRAFEGDGFDGQVLVEAVWFGEGRSLVPAWKGILPRMREDGAVYQVVVEDGTGRLLERRNILLHAAFRGRVFEEHPVAGPQTLQVFPDDAVQVVLESSDGWVEPGLTETLGPNVAAREDRDGDDTTQGATAAVTGGTGTAGDPYLFDFAFTDDPTVDQDLAITNLFYFNNLAHDRFYRLGFDEAAGNYQENTFGLGGVGGDPVNADAQDGSGLCNANFVPSPDGIPGRMNMFIWHEGAGCDPATAARDSSLDGDIVVHEYVHGVSTRLVGGRDDATCLFAVQPGALGEAWSDYFPGSFFDDPVVGEYATYDETNGVRTQPMDAPVERYTYSRMCTISGGALGCEVHADGEIWAQALWDLRQTLRGALGEAAGTDVADRIILNGMKFAPCSPSFLDARDGILAADRALYAGVHACFIWEAMARGGMGVDASTTGPADQEPVDGFAVPPECVDTGAVAFDRAAYLCQDELTVSVTDADATGPLQVLLTSDGGDSLLVDLPGPGPVFESGPVPFAVSGAVDPGNGVLEALAEGESLTAAYTDATSGGTVNAQALVDCTAQVRFLGYDIVEESCDDDTLPDFPELPRILDADETVRMQVRIGSDMPGKLLENTTAQLTSTHPSLVIVPAGPVDLGDLDPPLGSDPGEERVLEFAIEAVGPLLPSPDSADLEVVVTADGALRSAGGSFTIPLNQDYNVLSETLTDDFEDPALPGWALKPPGQPPENEWTHETCNANAGTGSLHNGEPGCGDYSDDQDDPWIASPPLDLSAATGEVVAVRVDGVNYWHDIDLGAFVIPGQGAIDAEAVVVQLQNEPIDVDLSDPFGLLQGSLAAYANIPPFLESNTSGQWVQEILAPDPNQFGDLDPTVPIRLVWAFLPDVTDFLFPCDNIFCQAQAGGYYLDDLSVDYRFVERIPDADICAPGSCQVAMNVRPTLSGPHCPGEAVLFDAAGSEALNCPSPAEVLWEDDQGNPIGTGDTFLQDPTLTTTRIFATITCPDDPACTARTEATAVVICDAVADTSGTALPALVCPGDDLDLDGGASFFSECTGAGMEYRWIGPSGPLSGFQADATATAVAPAQARADYFLEVRRQGDDSCFDSASLSVPVECGLSAAAQDPPGQPICLGEEITLQPDPAGTGLADCTGPLEYQWSGGNIASPSFGAFPDETVVIDQDTTYTLDVRRTDWPECAAQATVAVATTDGVPTGSLATALRVGWQDRANGLLLLDWSAGALTPDTYVVHSGTDPAALQLSTVTPATELVRMSGAGETLADAPQPAPGVTYYRVFSENFCTGEILEP